MGGISNTIITRIKIMDIYIYIACNRNATFHASYIILYVPGTTLPDMTNHALTLSFFHSNSIIHHFAATDFLFPCCLI